MAFWSWGEATPQDETQTASFWRWGETTAAPTPAPQPEERRPTFWWSEPEAPASTATYNPGDDAGALAARARELGLEERAARRKSAPSRRDVDFAYARQQSTTPEATTPEAPEDASPPKWSEPIARALWSAAHRISDPRQLGERLKRRLPAFRDALTHVPVRPGSRRIALTIDDAPSDLLGPVLDALKACGVKATFFVIADFCSTYARRQLLGRAVRDGVEVNPGVASIRMSTQVREGHELGNHMCDDVSCYGMSCDEFEKDLLRCDDLLAKLDPTWRRKKWRWFRPPRGYLNEDMLEPLNRLGYRVALADVFPLDTAVRSVDWLVDFVLEKARPGSIVLLHTPDLREAHDRRNNVQVFRELCPRLVKEYDVGTLSELVEQRRPTPPSPSLVEWDK